MLCGFSKGDDTFLVGLMYKPPDSDPRAFTELLNSIPRAKKKVDLGEC